MDGYVFKVDSVGNMIWEQIYGGLSIDVFSSITKKNEEYGYVLFGHTKSYMLDKSRKKKKGFIGRIIASMFKKEPSSDVKSINFKLPSVDFLKKPTKKERENSSDIKITESILEKIL